MGFALLLSGWAIVLATLMLFTGPDQRPVQRVAFVAAGVAIESLGLGLAAFGYKSLQNQRRKGGAAR
jgi:hypothetical protein